MSYEVRLTRQARKDVETLSPKLREKLRALLVNVLSLEPYRGKRLIGDLSGFYSLRLTLQDRVVYTIDDKRRVVFVARARTHYGD